MVRENRIQATCPKFVFNPKGGSRDETSDGLGHDCMMTSFTWWWNYMFCFHLFPKNEKHVTCTNVHWNNWRCVPCKLDPIMKWSISTCQFVAALPTKISQQIPRNSPHRWWILSASIGSPVLIKVPWVDDFAWKNHGKMVMKGCKRLRGLCDFSFWLKWYVVPSHEKLNIHIYTFQGGKMTFLFQYDMLVSRVRVMAFLVWQLWFHRKMFSIVF